MGTRSRKKFIEKHGATCNNWRYSWSFINESKKFIIFGAWTFHIEGNKTLIFSKDWQTRGGKKQSGYEQSRKHIRLIEEEGYQLKTFNMLGSQASKDKAAILKRFSLRLNDRDLRRKGTNWYAIDAN